MNKKPLLLVIALLVVPAVGASPRTYPVDATGLSCLRLPEVCCQYEAYPNCGPLECPVTDLSTGAICFPAFHIQKGDSGRAELRIVDDVWGALGQPVSALYCQDYDGNFFCGDNGEPNEEFCDTFILDTGESVGPKNWDPLYAVYVYLWYAMLELPSCNLPTIGAVEHAPI